MQQKPSEVVLGRTRFETALQVRPDDIDMNQHVHGSRYFDYVLAARYDQMERCYKMSMEEFLARGLGWFVQTAHIEYKRQLGLGERFIVKTWVQEILATGVRVDFEILKLPARKISCEGYFNYALIDMATSFISSEGPSAKTRSQSYTASATEACPPRTSSGSLHRHFGNM